MTLTIHYPNEAPRVFKNVTEVTFDKTHVVFKKKNVKSNFNIPVWYFKQIEIEG